VSALPTDYDARKAIPLASVVDYFPDALKAIAEASNYHSDDPCTSLVLHFMNRGTGRSTAFVAICALEILRREAGAEIRERERGLVGALDHFRDALCEIARIILAGQKQHGTTGWDRAKSTDEESTLLRHFLERGTLDTDGVRHSAKVAWRALALLQKEIEAARGDGVISRGSYDSTKGETAPGVTAHDTVREMPAVTDADLAAQRESWARGELAMGSDADEARERASALLCDHANECPAHCPCELLCYCKGRTCPA
jgi:hypothetical protein